MLSQSKTETDPSGYMLLGMAGGSVADSVGLRHVFMKLNCVLSEETQSFGWQAAS